MKEGWLSRNFVAAFDDGKMIEVSVKRFISMVDTQNAAIRYSVKALNFSGTIAFTPYIDGDVENEDSNYDEKFWNILEKEVRAGEAFLLSQTKKLDFRVAFGMKYKLFKDNRPVSVKPELIKKRHGQAIRW
jgi:Trehalose and maltose hydrolases (possible phosphorylases)